MLGGCTKEELGGGEPLPEGKYPLEFTSTAYRLDVKTRATTDNSWDGGEAVAIKIGDVTKKYVADQNGNLTAAEGVTPFCWTSTNETKTVTAWCPYSSSQPTSFRTQPDQNTNNGYLKSDFIVECKEISFSDAPKELTFQHLTAQVTVNITGNNIPDLSSATVTLTNVANGINNINVTPGSITTGVVTGNGTKTPKVVSATTDKIIVQALLPPSRLAYGPSAKDFVKVDLDGQTYIYTLPIDNYSLSAGMSYTFDITVQGQQP